MRDFIILYHFEVIIQFESNVFRYNKILIDCVFGNSKFVVPSTLTIDLGFALVNSQSLGDNKLAIPSYPVNKYILSMYICICVFELLSLKCWSYFEYVPFQEIHIVYLTISSSPSQFCPKSCSVAMASRSSKRQQNIRKRTVSHQINLRWHSTNSSIK